MSQKLETIDPEIEPEYVGAHSARVSPQCQDIHDANGRGEPFEPEQCENWSTHTIVMKDEGGLHEPAMCDNCGEPDDVNPYEQKWAGEIQYEGEQ